jgi:hypothetical protein
MAKWSKHMPFVSIPTLKTFRDEDNNTVTFKPIVDVPGFSHRVIVNHTPVDYLDNRHAKPSAKVAEFFFQKHKEKIFI